MHSSTYLASCFTYRLASLLQMLCSTRGVSAPCIYASSHVLDVLFTSSKLRLGQLISNVVCSPYCKWCVYLFIYLHTSHPDYVPAGQLISIVVYSPYCKCCLYLCIHLCIWRLVCLPVDCYTREPEPPKASATGRMHRKASSSSSKQRYIIRLYYVSYICILLCTGGTRSTRCAANAC
jgi:hypothetical protein